jgi:hypothetical protein
VGGWVGVKLEIKKFFEKFSGCGLAMFKRAVICFLFLKTLQSVPRLCYITMTRLLRIDYREQGE